MRKRSVLISILLTFLFGSIGLFVAGCSSSDDGKIPITTSSDKARALFVEGRDYSENLRGSRAISLFQDAIILDSNFALAHLNLSFLQTNTDNFFAYLERAESLADRLSKGEQLAIKVARANADGDPLLAGEYFEQMVEAYPKDERAHYSLGNYYFGQQEYVLALEQYDDVKKLDSNFSPVYNQAGYAYRNLGDYDKAENSFRKYIDLIPNDPNPYDSYAEMLMKIGKFDASIEWYQKAIAVDSSFVPSYLGVANNLALLNQFDSARSQLAELFQIAPTSRDKRQALLSTAVTFVDQRDFSAAIIELQKSLVIAKEDSDLGGISLDHFLIGQVMAESGDFDSAKKQFELGTTVIEQSDLPEGTKENARLNLQFGLARTAAAQNDETTTRKHIAVFRELAEVKSSPFQVRRYHQLEGILALLTGDYDRAIGELQQTNQQNVYNVYRLMLAYRGKGELQNARILLKQVLHFNQFYGLNYAFVRPKAQAMTTQLP